MPQPIRPETRAEVEALLKQLADRLARDAAFDGGSRTMSAQEAKAMLLTKMIRGLGGAATVSDLVAAAKIEMYADAIDDLPAWALNTAIKLWGKGECPRAVCEEPNYAFPPSPAVLRGLVLEETRLLREHAERFTRLLAAVPTDRAMDPKPFEGKTAVPALRSMA